MTPPAARSTGGSGSQRHRPLRFYSSPAGAPTTRRATDWLLLVPALLGLALLVVLYPPGPLERSLTRFLASVPGWTGSVWGALFDLLLLCALLLAIAVLATRRWRLALQIGAALLLAAAIALVATRLAVGVWPGVLDAVGGGSGAPRFPAFRLAQAATVILTVTPHLVSGFQRLGRWTIALGLIGSLLVNPTSPSGGVAAVLVAVVAAAGVRLAFGTSVGRPGLEDVRASLAILGIETTQLTALTRQVSGVFSLGAAGADGAPLLVKVYGRDAYDTQLLATFWRSLWYEGASLTAGLNRSQAVEREALATLLAARAGVPTREVVVAGSMGDGDAVLVLRGAAQPLVELAEDETTDVLLAQWWSALGRLHTARIAHRAIGPDTVAVVAGSGGLVDFGGAMVMARPEQLQSDCAQLLVATAATVGPERALHAALEALGREGVAELLPYLQPPALGAPLRSALRERGLDVDDLRRAAAAAAGTEEPELARIRRLTWGGAAQLVLLVLAVLALMKIVANVDYEQLLDDLEDAAWAWIALAVVVAQLPRLTQAASTLGAIAADIRFGPLYVLQLATSYLNLALPSSLARMTVAIRFFQRQGQPPAAAVTAGAIDSLATNLIQGGLVVGILVFSSHEVALGLESPGSGPLRLLWILGTLLAGTVLVVVLVPRIRHAVTGRIREWWPQIRASLGALRAPHKLGLLLGANLATEVLFAAALGLMARGFGYEIPLLTLIFVNSGTSLLSSFIPVPGGVGVVEFALEVGLTSAGMTPTAALATILLYRAATFYLPPAWGFFAFRWLQRNRYL